MPKSKNARSQNNETARPKTNRPGREVDFVPECIGAEHVYVCTDFNGWQPACLHLIGNGEPNDWLEVENEVVAEMIMARTSGLSPRPTSSGTRTVTGRAAGSASAGFQQSPAIAELKTTPTRPQIV